jgi:hypothetical protein
MILARLFRVSNSIVKIITYTFTELQIISYHLLKQTKLNLLTSRKGMDLIDLVLLLSLISSWEGWFNISIEKSDQYRRELPG